MFLRTTVHSCAGCSLNQSIPNKAKGRRNSASVLLILAECLIRGLCPDEGAPLLMGTKTPYASEGS